MADYAYMHPRLVDLSPGQVMSLEENRDLLQETGFVVDFMGGQSYAIKEFPDIFNEKEAYKYRNRAEPFFDEK